jgi:protease-4
MSVIFYLLLIGFFASAFRSDVNSGPKVLYGSGDNQIAVIDITGIITETDASGSPLAATTSTSSRRILSVLETIKQSEEVKAVILRINSPGGSVTASEEIYQIISQFKADTGIPVIVSMADVAASGGYYVALAGDHIIASSTTLTGSIGAIIQSINFKDLANNFGVRSVTITSGPNKDMLNPLEEVNPQQIQILQQLVNEAYNLFLNRVSEGRALPRQQLQAIADGRVISGLQARQAGLVDQVGTFHDAVIAAQQRAQIGEAQVVIFGQRSPLEELLGVIADRFTPTSQVPFLSTLQTLHGQPAYLYLQ